MKAKRGAKACKTFYGQCTINAGQLKMITRALSSFVADRLDSNSMAVSVQNFLFQGMSLRHFSSVAFIILGILQFKEEMKAKA